MSKKKNNLGDLDLDGVVEDFDELGLVFGAPEVRQQTSMQQVAKETKAMPASLLGQRQEAGPGGMDIADDKYDELGDPESQATGTTATEAAYSPVPENAKVGQEAQGGASAPLPANRGGEL